MDHRCTLVEVLAMLDLFLESVAKQAKEISDGSTIRSDVDVIGLELQHQIQDDNIVNTLKMCLVSENSYFLNDI